MNTPIDSETVPIWDRTQVTSAESAMSYLMAKSFEAMKTKTKTKTRRQAQLMTRHYLERMNLDISPLKVVHVAGSKGKGSTCVFTENILHSHGLKTGLYTSPHLVTLTERFRINTKPVPNDLFLEHFWATWDLLMQSRHLCGIYDPMPGYFSFLTLVGLRLYTHEGVDILVLEVGLGGKLDATNVIDHPYSCAVTHLALEHCEILGHSIDLIAREKSGIFKKDASLFTIEQDPIAMKELILSAQDVNRANIANNVDNGIISDKAMITEGDASSLQIVEPLAPYPIGPKLSLYGNHQRNNGAMAVCLAYSAMQRLVQNGKVIPLFNSSIPLDQYISLQSAEKWYQNAIQEERYGKQIVLQTEHIKKALLPLPIPFIHGLETTELDGRCQTVPCTEVSNLTFYLDGAHTEESMQLCVNWFADVLEHQEQIDDRLSNPSTSTVGVSETGINHTNSNHNTSQIQQQQQREHLQKVLQLTSTVPKPKISTVNSNDELILVFNCGHVRNPFYLLEPIIKQGFTELEANIDTVTTEGQTHDITTHLVAPHTSQPTPILDSAVRPIASSSLKVQFQNIVLCPFDNDKDPISARQPFSVLALQTGTMSTSTVFDDKNVPNLDISNTTETKSKTFGHHNHYTIPQKSPFYPVDWLQPHQSRNYDQLESKSDEDNLTSHVSIAPPFIPVTAAAIDSALSLHSHKTITQSSMVEDSVFVNENTRTYPKVLFPSISMKKSDLSWQHTLAGTWHTMIEAYEKEALQLQPIQAVQSATQSVTQPHIFTHTQPSSLSSSSPPSSPLTLWDMKEHPSTLYTVQKTHGLYPYQTQCVQSVQSAIQHIRQLALHQPDKKFKALVTGSLYLVGNVLHVLSKNKSIPTTISPVSPISPISSDLHHSNPPTTSSTNADTSNNVGINNP